MQSNDYIRINFAEKDEIKANTLKATIETMQICINDMASNMPSMATKKKSKPKPEVIVKISKGSVIVDFFIQYGATVIGGLTLLTLPKLVKLFSIKKKLGNTPPKSVITQNGVTTITKENDEQFTADSETANLYFESKRIDPAISKMNKQIATDNTRTSFDISQVQNGVVTDVERYTKTDAINTAIPINFSNVTKITIDTMPNIRISIDKNYLQGNGQWEIITQHNHERISVTVTDQVFLEKWRAGEIKTDAQFLADLQFTNRSNIISNKLIGKPTCILLKVNKVIETHDIKNVSMFE
jgi:hypothetical protein